jgi:LysM repeat protein
VAVATLKQWNNLSSETVKKNEKLVIGFIKSNELPSVTIKPKPVQEVAEVAVTEEEVLSKKDKEAEKKKRRQKKGGRKN